MSRWAAGTRGAGVTSTLRPMIEASTRRAPRTEEPSRTMENSISLSVMRQSWEMEVNGPT